MNCPQCQTENIAQARFCCECGSRLEQVCPFCGAANGLVSKFCQQCGESLGAIKGKRSESQSPTLEGPKAQKSPGALREERRWATLLFADLSGFTKISERLDPEDVKALAHRCTERMGEEVKRFGGTVITIAGDQVVAAFGAPVAHEDDAERAVRTALAMRDCPLQDNDGNRIKIHVGLNTGEVMAGLIGPHEHQDYAVMGDTTNVAARLMGAAPSGSVLVGEETWRATRGVIKYRELPPVQFKGKQQPLPVWEALEVLAGPKSRPLGTAVLVGRDEELGMLSGIWLRVVREGRPHLVTVLGDPGLGKSRLAAEFEKRFCADARVIHGRCLPYGESMGYWALATAIKEIAGITPELDTSAARTQLDRLVRGIFAQADETEVGELARHLALLGGLDSTQDRSGNAVDQRTLHGSVRRFLEALARQQPLCWMVEDIHWADDALLDLIEFVACRAKEAPLLVFTQARPGLLEKRPTWGSGVRAFTSLPLETLGPQEARELVIALCRERGLPESVTDEVGRGAAGNPLFAEELVAMIAERGQKAGVPSAIKALIAARIDALPAAERRTLQLAAVFGKAFWVGGLRAIGADAKLGEHLERLEQMDLLRSQSRSQFRNEPEFAFKHDLIRDVAYDMLPRGERRPLHGRIADWMQRAAGDSVDSYLDQLAHHTVSAGLEERALGFLTETAERARAVAAHRRAAELLAQAIAIAERLGRSELAGDLLARRGTALERVGMWIEARPELERALQKLPPQQEARRAEVLLTLTGIAFWLLDLSGVAQHCAEAIVLAQNSGRADLIADAQAWRAASKYANGESLEAGALFQQIIDHPTARIAPLSLYVAELYHWGRIPEAVRVSRNLVGRLRGQGDTVSPMFAYPHLGLALAASGQYQEAARAFEEARRIGQEYQVNPFLARSVSMSAGFHLDLFDYVGNEALNQEAQDLARTNNFPPAVVSASIDLWLNYVRRGDVPLAENLVDSTERAVVQTKGWHEWLWNIRIAQAKAELALARSSWTEALGCAEDAIRQSQLKLRPKYELLGLWARARALDGLGRRHEAIANLNTALSQARTLGDPAIFLRLASTLLPMDGTDALAIEAEATIQRIIEQLPDGSMRRHFEKAEPVQVVRKLAGSKK